MINGLWQGPNAVTQDFLTVMYRIQALGFNAVRVPMSFQARAPRARSPAGPDAHHLLCRSKRMRRARSAVFASRVLPHA